MRGQKDIAIVCFDYYYFLIFYMYIFKLNKKSETNLFFTYLRSPMKIVNQTSKKISTEEIRKTLAVTCTQQRLK